MAHIDDSGNQGRSKTVDLNIVPFIDLMSVLVIFLLITAVWTQVSMIQIGSSIYGKKTEDVISEPPPRAEIPFRVDVTPKGYLLVIGRDSMSIPKQDDNYNTLKLKEELLKIKQTYPEKNDAIITMNDELAYVNLIDGMDALLQSGFPEISVATGGN